MRAWDGDMFDDDYGISEQECKGCTNLVYYTQDYCEVCVEEREYLDNLEYETKADRREARRAKGRYGPVRHLPGDFRPPKIRIQRVKAW